MVLMIPGIYRPGQKMDPNFTPPADKVIEISKFNDELRKAGAIIAVDGLHPLVKGARVTFAGGKPTVTDGPFIEAKEVFGGYWLRQGFQTAGDDRMDEALPGETQ